MENNPRNICHNYTTKITTQSSRHTAPSKSTNTFLFHIGYETRMITKQIRTQLRNIKRQKLAQILLSPHFLMNKLLNLPLSNRSSSFLAPGISISASFLR